MRISVDIPDDNMVDTAEQDNTPVPCSLVTARDSEIPDSEEAMSVRRRLLGFMIQHFKQPGSSIKHTKPIHRKDRI